MITTNSNWDTKNAALAKMPIYAFTIAGQATVYTTHDLVAAGITGTLPTYLPWMKTPRGPSQSVDVVNGSSSIGELQCDVIDPDGSVRTLVGGTVLEGAAVTLKVGYPGLAWSEFVVLHSYVLYKINPVSGYTAWSFLARDRQLLLKKTIYAHPENGHDLSEANPWFLTGSPVEIFQAIALFAAGLAATDIDRTQMVALDSAAEGLYAAARPFQFRITESFAAKQFLEQELLKPCAMYCVVLNTGALSLRAPRPPAAGTSPVFTFTEDNMTVLPEIDRLPIVNEAVWEFDSDGNDYGLKQAFVRTDSIAAFGRGDQWSVQSKGLRSELGACWFARWVSEKLFRRFAGTPTGLKGGAPVLSIDAFFLTLPVWVGDYVAVTHTKMPDVTTGALGVTDRIYEVIDRSPDYEGGKMQYKLLDTGLTGLPLSRQWGAGSTRPFVIGSSLLF